MLPNISATNNAISVNDVIPGIYVLLKNSVADEYIDYVSIGGINNTTAGNAG
jgi:hypothetical protein